MIVKQIYLIDFGKRDGKPYYVFVERADSFAEDEKEIVVNYE